MRVIVLRGIPGSGKSHQAASITGATIVSADHFFIEHTGEYKFVPSLLGEAHAACLRRYLEELRSPSSELLIVDNTNASVAEIAPYMALASAFGVNAEIIEVDCDPVEAAARNIHGVPADVVMRIHTTMRANNALLPAWWKRTILTPPA